MRGGVGAIALWAGCGPSVEQFQEDFAEAMCARYETCAERGTAAVEFGSRAECEAFWTGVNSSLARSCDYDAAAARACLGAVWRVECETINAGGRIGECGAVFGGDACAWTAGTSTFGP